MTKFLSGKYYYILIATAVYFVFNATVRDSIIDRLVNPEPNKPITENATAYAKETMIRDIFVYSILVSLVLLFIISAALLFSKQERKVSKAALITVLVLITLFFLAWVGVGGLCSSVTIARPPRTLIL